MAKGKTIEELQVEHSRLCALAADNGVALPEELTAEFEDVEAGGNAVAGIGKLLTEAGVDHALAKDSEVEQGAAAPKTKKAKAAKAEKKTKPATDVAQAAEAAEKETETMAKTAKKTKAKKAPAKKSTKKTTAKKAVAGKKGGVKGAKKKSTGPRADSMTSKIIAKMKNGGITREQVLKMTGWKAVSMQQLAGNAGVTLKKSEERPFTYTCK